MYRSMVNRVFNGFVLVFLLVNLVGIPTLATASPAHMPEPKNERLVEASATTGVISLISNFNIIQEISAVSADGNFVAFQQKVGTGDGVSSNLQVAVHNRDTGETTFASVSSEGILGNGSSGSPSISADGRYVVFRSMADNLVPGDTNGAWDIFVHDMETNETKRVSVKSNGLEANGESRRATISANGRYVAFASRARNLLPASITSGVFVYVHDLETGITTFTNERAGDTVIPSPVFISSNGRYLVFEGDGLRVIDRQTGERTTLSGQDPSISSDGRFVAYSAYYNSQTQIFVYDLQTGENTQVSVSSEGVAANDMSIYPRISANGRYVVFQSMASNLVPVYPNAMSIFHFYLHDRFTGETIPVSVSLDGSLDGSGGSHAGGERPAISADGRTVVFISNAKDLVVGYSGGPSKPRGLYVYDRRAKPPVIIVHGWQGLSGEGGYRCDENIQPYDGTNTTLMPHPDLENYSHLAEWLKDDGYDVWIAHLDSGPFGTPALEENAKCLAWQIEKVWQANPQPISMIAHSMGGLVSRGAIRIVEPEIDIESLYTLGSPHAGVVLYIPMIGFFSDVKLGPGGHQMMLDSMILFNAKTHNIKDVQYHFFGGGGGEDVMDIVFAWLRYGYNKLLIPQPTDGFVSQYSAVGWYDLSYPLRVFLPLNWIQSSHPGQYFTNESHPTLPSNQSQAYYIAPEGGYSQSYRCIRDLMVGLTGTQSCMNIKPWEIQPTSGATSSESFGFTQNYAGHLESGQNTSFSVDMDGSSEVIFYLNWVGESAPVFTLTSPAMVEITPQYVLENPEVVSYESSSGTGQSLPYQTYRFPAGEIGTWQVNLSASSDEIDYQVFAVLESDRLFEAELDQYTYQIGETANIAASLGSDGVGLSGATVIASITSSDGAETQLTLTDNQDGTYSGSYLIPDAPGYLTLNLTAAGEDDGVAYTRSANLVAAIAPNDLTLTGEYAEEPIDDDNSLLYEKLAFDLGVNLAEPGSYLVSAELYAGDELIIHTGDFFDLAAGAQTVRLLFDGQAIRDSGLDGPYTVTNLFLTPTDLGITAQEAVDVFQTAPYRHTQFGLSAPPAAFGKSSPSSGVTEQPSSITLSWANSDGAISYEYCLDTTDNAECDTSWISTGAETVAVLDGLTAGATYFWQVRADNFEGLTDADGGDWWSFTAAPARLSCPAGGVIYVDQEAGGNNDGSSWQNAFTDLQIPLVQLDEPCKIWVAEGSYKPHASDRAVSFTLKNGIEIFGGFAGTETAIEQRDFENNLTILSGDLLEDDNENIARDEPARSENSYHVIVGSGTDSSAVLDGLTVTGGNANEDGYPDTCSGAGMYLDAGSPVLANLVFSANSACSGGGMANHNGSHPTLENVSFNSNVADHGGGVGNYENSSPVFENVSFTSNVANFGAGMANQSGSSPTLENVSFDSNSAGWVGGGMSNENNSSSVLINVTFSNNSAVKDGGGMYNLDSSPTLAYVVFNGNTAGNAGGGMLIGSASSNSASSNSASSPTLTEVVFQSNSAIFGGGAFISTGSPNLMNVIFHGNSAEYGGGLTNTGDSIPTLTNVTFSANSAKEGGGMRSLRSSTPVLTNVTFNGNSADHGGGMQNLGNSSPTLTNVTFSANSASEGGGMLSKVESNPVLTNVTFNGNSADLGGGILNLDKSSPTLKNVIVANSLSGGDCVNAGSGILNLASGQNLIEDNSKACGLVHGLNGNIIGRDPLLGVLQDNSGFTETHALLPGSPAVNAGTNIGCPVTDQRGISRPQGIRCDIGAYEYVNPPVVFEKLGPTNGETGVSLSATLFWKTNIEATGYEYCYSSAPGPCSTWHSVGNETSVALSGLAPNYTYYWQVRAITSGGSIELNGGAWWSFTTTSVPSCTFAPHVPPLTPSFVDVPLTHWAWSWIERSKSAGLTTGCAWVPGGYCPGDNVTREQMAVFIMRAKRCGSYTPDPVTSAVFTDVPANHWAAGFIRDLRDAKISTGCAWVPGGYCPGDNITREQMAVFIIRAKHGGTYSPPLATGTVFSDVPAGHWAASFIEQLYRDGITTGCAWVPGGYCPGSNVTREQMAVFIGKAFNLLP